MSKTAFLAVSMFYYVKTETFVTGVSLLSPSERRSAGRAQ